jgi:hypothetical protein
MAKNKNLAPDPIAWISFVAALAISLGVVAHAKLVPVVPNNSAGVPELQNVMHSDLYWSPLDECSEGGLADTADCHATEMTSTQKSNTEKSKPRHESDKPSQDVAVDSGGDAATASASDRNTKALDPIQKPLQISPPLKYPTP